MSHVTGPLFGLVKGVWCSLVVGVFCIRAPLPVVIVYWLSFPHTQKNNINRENLERIFWIVFWFVL